MIHPWFVWADPQLALIAEREHEAKKLLGRHPLTREAKEALVVWWREETLAGHFDSYRKRLHIPTTALQLLPDALRPGIERAIGGAADDEPQVIAAWWLIGGLVAEHFGGTDPPANIVEGTLTAQAMPHYLSKAFGTGLCERLRGNDELRSAWVGALTRITEGFLERIVQSNRFLTHDLLLDIQTRWRARSSPFAILAHDFGRRGDRAINFGVDLRRLERGFYLASFVHPAGWIAAIEQLPIPHLMWHAVFLSDLRRDGDTLLEVIRHAPITFDNGKPTGNVTAVMTLSCAIDYIRAFHDNVERVANGEDGFHPEPVATERRERGLRDRSTLESTEIPNWLDRFHEALLERADAQSLVYEWCSRLAIMSADGEYRRDRGSWLAAERALRSLAVSLAIRGTGATIFQDWWAERERAATARVPNEPDSCGEGARSSFTDGVSYLVAAAYVLNAHIGESRTAPGFTDTLMSLWTWAVHLLKSRNPGLDLARRPAGGLVYDAIGYLLIHHRGPVEAWCDAWRALEPQRRRLAFAGTSDGARDASSNLIYVGLSACARLRQHNPMGHPEHCIERLFWRINEAAWLRYLTTGVVDVNRERETRGVVSDCFAFLPLLFKDVVSVGRSAARPILGTPSVVEAAKERLLANHVDPDTVDMIFDD